MCTIRRGDLAGVASLARMGLSVALCLLLYGCVRPVSDKTADGRTIVTYWEKWTGFEGEALQAVVDDFNASQNAILVQLLAISQVDRKLMLATAGGNPPDLAGLWSSNIADFSEKGALTPLGGMAAKAEIAQDDYTPVYWDACCHRGFLWALPTTPATVALHWNKKLFRDAGLDPDRPPRTLQELERMSDLLTVVEVERGGRTEQVRFNDLSEEERRTNSFKLLQVGHLPQEPGWWMAFWGYWFGGQLWDGQSRITVSSPENVAALEWLASHAHKYGVENLRTFGASFGNFSSPQNAFLAGRVAMVLQGVWMYNFIDKYAPHLEWGAAPFPNAQGGLHTTLAESDVIVIPRGARHVDEAFAFIRYMQSPPVLEKLNMGQRKFSPLAHTSDSFLANHPNPAIKTFIDLAGGEGVYSVPRLSVWREFQSEMQVAVDQVMALRTRPADALEVVQRRMQSKLDRMLRRWELVKDERLAEWSSYDAR